MPLPTRKVSSTSQSQRILFDNFEADMRSGELRKNGSRVKLQAHPFRLLVLLLKSCGEVVTRDEIGLELWPDNTFVDFEHGLAASGATASSTRSNWKSPKSYRVCGGTNRSNLPPFRNPKPELVGDGQLACWRSPLPPALGSCCFCWFAGRTTPEIRIR